MFGVFDINVLKFNTLLVLVAKTGPPIVIVKPLVKLPRTVLITKLEPLL